MRRGPWHQFGFNSHNDFALDLLRQGAGVGVIISSRDLALQGAIEYSQKYHELDAHVLLDLQFYVPNFSNAKMDSYEISEYRLPVSRLHQVTNDDLTRLTSKLESICIDLSPDGLIAPAIVYEAGRTNIIELNARLFENVKRVGDNLGIPTYATVVLGNSVISSDETINAILSSATSLNCDGWYFSFEFDHERIPSSRDSIYRCCTAGLTLACTGKPVLHAYSGPMALLSLGFGAQATAIGNYQNLWKFPRERWRPTTTRRGRGSAPARYFSSAIWGTIVYPDEIARLSIELQNQVLTQSAFSTRISPGPPFLPFSRWDANKHLVSTICSTVTAIASNSDPRSNAAAAISILERAVDLHSRIAGTGISLRDNTAAYQENWRVAMSDLLNIQSCDFDYLEMLR